MKKIILTLLVLVLLLVGFVAAQDEQPELLNHQFYGEVTWAMDSPVPSTLTAMLGDAVFTSEIRSSPCLEDPCKGRYGYDPDNILRIQGEGGQILFIIDGVEVGEHPYQEDTVTKLDFDLRPEEEEEETPSNGGGVADEEDEEPVNETVETPTPPEPEEVVVTPTPKPVTPKQVPQFQMPTAQERGVSAEEDEGVNIYLIAGIVLIVAAIGVVTFLVIKKRKEAEEF